MTEPQQEAFGGVPAWLLLEYLVELGGHRDDDGTVGGEGWRARLDARPKPAGGLSIGRVTVTIDGPESAQVMARLREKAQRGGG
ncbi:MAG TPA: DUF1952 domain-containing protein [Dehalococcoidia bacterium]|nr:DUF1952 domain-containing protein [Dehalococcoidia bacterium]